LKIKHSLIIQTYNQEQFIAQAIESALNQSIPPYEIIVGDDCSTDGTEAIIQMYCCSFPKIIRYFRQKKNLGIMCHLNFLRKQVRGDIISIMGGDDYLLDGMFKAFDEAIISEQLEPTNDKFILLSNHYSESPNGCRELFDNTRIKGKNLLGQRLRYGLSYRDCGISRALFDTLDPHEVNIGVYADFVWGFDQVAKSQKFVFINKAFYVYRLGIGIISKLDKSTKAESRRKALEIIKAKYKERLSFSDRLFLSFEFYKAKYDQDQNFGSYAVYFILLVLNVFNFSPNNPVWHNLKRYRISKNILPGQ